MRSIYFIRYLSSKNVAIKQALTACLRYYMLQIEFLVMQMEGVNDINFLI